MPAKGYYLMYRGWMENAIFPAEPYTQREAFQWLIERAAWDDSIHSVGQRRVPVKRGQLAIATRYLAEKWQWGKGKVDRFLKTLKNGAMIEAQSGADYTLITICNYRRYQDMDDEDGAQSGAPTGAQAGRERGNYIDKPLKPEKESDARAREPAAAMADPKAGASTEEMKALVAWLDEYLNSPRPYVLAPVYQWLGKGASLDLVRDVIATVTERQRARQADWRPGLLMYFNPEMEKRLSAPMASASSAAAGFDPMQAQWRQRIGDFKASTFWLDNWGDTPDEPGCVAPLSVLIEFGYRQKGK